MAVIQTLEEKKEINLGDKEIITNALIIMAKDITVFDELWLVLDYCAIALLFYANHVYIQSRLFSLGLFIGLMVLIFCAPNRKKKVKINSKEELLRSIDKFYEENGMTK